MRRLRIVSDGTPLSERVYDADTGEMIEGIAEARIELSQEHMPLVWLRFIDAEIDIVADEQPPQADGCGGEGWVFVHREDCVSIPDAGEAIARDFMADLRRALQEPA